MGYTQQKLAEKLNISFQAISKWENDVSMPDISMLVKLADLLNTSVEALVGYPHTPQTEYEAKYQSDAYYWGFQPNRLCYDILKLKPPVQPLRVLDMGCGEGKDAVFLARNGYLVSAFELAESGLEKARQLASLCHTSIDFFKADITNYHPTQFFDIIFCSGVLHYLPKADREAFFDRLKHFTLPHGIHVFNVFVHKPFIEPAPDLEEAEQKADPWFSGELFRYYHDWRFHLQEEIIFDCESGGQKHQHCMARMIAEKP